MPHHLIAGMTESGKSSLAKMICRRQRAAGHFTVVLDPLGIAYPDWPAHVVTGNPDAFMWFAKQWNPAEHGGQCLRLFVDEGAESMARGLDYNWLATQSRHWGTVTHFISQSPQDFQPAIRRNCHHLWLFRVDGSAVEPLAREWALPALRDATALPQLHFKYARRFSDLQTGKVDFAKQSIVWLPAASVAPAGSLSDSTAGPTPRAALAHQQTRRKGRK